MFFEDARKHAFEIPNVLNSHANTYIKEKNTTQVHQAGDTKCIHIAILNFVYRCTCMSISRPYSIRSWDKKHTWGTSTTSLFYFIFLFFMSLSLSLSLSWALHSLHLLDPQLDPSTVVQIIIFIYPLLKHFLFK